MKYKVVSIDISDYKQIVISDIKTHRIVCHFNIEDDFDEKFKLAETACKLLNEHEA